VKHSSIRKYVNGEEDEWVVIAKKIEISRKFYTPIESSLVLSLILSDLFV
jgi:hypothetical protein